MEHGNNQNIYKLGLLETGEEALVARLSLIRSATSTIEIQTFIWANDETGRLFVYELLEAAKRGVRVRVLIDGWVTIGSPQLVAFMGVAHDNIEVKHFNPPANRIDPSTFDLVTQAFDNFSSMNRRMHNKLVLVDDSLAIIGGRNIQNDYYDRNETRNFLDRDLLIAGPELKDYAGSFQDFWNSSSALPGERLEDFAEFLGKKGPPYNSTESFDLGSHFESVSKTKKSVEDFLQFSETKSSNIRYICDSPSSSTEDLNETQCELLSFLERAEERILLESPYFVLDSSVWELLKRVRQKRPNLRIQVITNSLASTDNVVAYAHSYRERARYLIDLELEMFELKPRPADISSLLGYQYFLEHNDKDIFERKLRGRRSAQEYLHICCHSKTYVCDNDKVWIGSVNLDPRSARLNSENAVVLNNQEVASEIAEQMHRLMLPKNSWTVGIAEDGPGMEALRSILCSLIPSGEDLYETLFRWTDSFELREGFEPCSCYHDDFYNRYESCGSFPMVEGTTRDIQVWLMSVLPDNTREYV